MFKKISVALISLSLFIGAFSACGEQVKVDENNSSKTKANNPSISVNGDLLSGLANGFPEEVPFYEGAKVMSSKAIGDDGFNVIYDVNDTYENVVGFYMTTIDGLDESGIGDEESSFQDIEFEGVCIDGITITDNGDKTTVYIITNGYYDNADTDDTTEQENDNSDSLSYASAVEVPLDIKYPEDIVPIYPDAKIISCSLAPSGSGFVELVLPSGSYESAVDFYTSELGLPSEDSKTQVQESARINGNVSGWKVSILIGRFLGANSDPTISITVSN